MANEPTPTDAEINALAEAYLLRMFGSRVVFNGTMIDFARAVLAKWGVLRAEKIVIPTDTMEQEFQKHYRRGYEAGKKATTPQPTHAQAGAVPLNHKNIEPVRRFLADRGIYLSDETTKALITVSQGIKGGQRD